MFRECRSISNGVSLKDFCLFIIRRFNEIFSNKDSRVLVVFLSSAFLNQLLLGLHLILIFDFEQFANLRPSKLISDKNWLLRV